MTGEITLRGQVLPIGGVKEKVLAAHRIGIRTIILPRRNELDLDDVPDEIKQTMKFIFVETVDEVIDASLESKNGHRITSYNVCYTKLLRLIIRQIWSTYFFCS